MSAGLVVPTCGHRDPKTGERCTARATHRSAEPVAIGGGNFLIERRCAPHAAKGMVRAYAPPAHARPSPTRHLRPLDPTLLP